MDSSAQPLMLRNVACIDLGIQNSNLKPCPFQIQTSLGRASDRSHFMACERLSMQMRSDHTINNSKLGMIVVVIAVESYDVLVGGVVFYPMGFQMDYWMETTAYRPSWQSEDGWMSQVLMGFISRVRP